MEETSPPWVCDPCRGHGEIRPLGMLDTLLQSFVHSRWQTQIAHGFNPLYMPKGGFEPPRLVRHHPLKMACLPLPPLRLRTVSLAALDAIA